MITIQRENTKLKVSKGAFDLYYKGIGFKVVEVKEEKAAVKPAEEVSKPDEKVVENPVAKADEKSEEKSEGAPAEETNKEPKSEGKENKAPKTPRNENPNKVGDK